MMTEFAELARRLGVECRKYDLQGPSFRAPPRSPSALRTLRRTAQGDALVSVAVRGRSRADVVCDMIEGVILANRLDPATANNIRTCLIGAVQVSEPRVA